MPKKRYSAERVVTLLRQIEVSMAQRNATPVACRDAAYLCRVFIAGTRNTVGWRSIRPSG